MNLIEYKQLLLEEFAVSSEVNLSPQSSEFIDFAINMLNDTEEVFDLEVSYLQMKDQFNRKILIDGYAYEEADKSFSLFISKFNGEEEITTITKTEIETYLKNMQNFIESALSRFIQKNTESSSEGNQIAERLYRLFHDQRIAKFKLYIITNCVLSDRVKTINYNDIYDKKVEANVWDLNRFYESDQNNRIKEQIYIDFTKYHSGKGIPAIKAFDGGENEYTAYLAVISGELLASLYDEYGSRLLEGNVRSFLSASGKVNKGIKETILKSPKYFFTYNNGIATTASSIETVKTDEGLEIIGVNDLQIINGGQTTASLLNTKINHKNETRLDEIFVPMKLTVIKSDNFSQMVENISRTANSQNKVSDADFFSNSSFHIRIEQLSKEHLAPAVNGNQYQTVWFYERARGSYKQEQMKLSKANREKFMLKHPKKQLITKTDLAKYMNSFYQMPHSVSRGAQKNMKNFADKIEKVINGNDANINEYFYKSVISNAIIFKDLENEIKKSEWFPSGSGYRANIITYTISKLYYLIEKQYPNKGLNFELIWSKQKVYPELKRVLSDLAKITFDYITSDKRLIMNISEWCKKEDCWKGYQSVQYILPNYFSTTLMDLVQIKEKQNKAKKNQRFVDTINAEIDVVNLGSLYWEKLMIRAKDMKICNIIEEADLRIAINMEKTGKTPNSIQAKRLMQFRSKCSSEGIDIENL